MAVVFLLLSGRGALHAHVTDVVISSSYYRTGKDYNSAMEDFRNKTTVRFDTDLNNNNGTSSYYVYLGYRSSNEYQGTLTGLILVEGAKRDTVFHDGKVYCPVTVAGFSDGNLKQRNSSSGDRLYLYQTRDDNENMNGQVLTRIELVTSSSQPGLVQLAKVDENNNVTGFSGPGNINPKEKTGLYIRGYWHSHTGLDPIVRDETGHRFKCSSCAYISPYISHYSYNPKSVSDTQHSYECMSCGYIRYEDHDYSSVQAGMSSHSHICSTCHFELIRPHGESISTVYYSVDNHDHMGVCSDCYFSVRSSHDLKSIRIIAEADCCHEGEELLQCQTDGCGATVVQKIARTPHRYVDGICVNPGCHNRYEPARLDFQTRSYLIANPGNLMWFSTLVNSGDVNASAILLANISIPSDFDFTPIGKDVSLAFKGQFDGNGYMVTGLHSAMFGHIAAEGSVIRIHVRKSSVANSMDAAAVALVNAGRIDDCTVAESTVWSLSLSAAAGAVCAYNTGLIRNCSVGNDVVVAPESSTAAGICGTNHGSVADCISMAVNQSGNVLALVGSGAAAIEGPLGTKGSFYVESLFMTKSSLDTVNRTLVEEQAHFKPESTTPVIMVARDPENHVPALSAWYDLSGRRVTQLLPGNIYLNDGRKIVIPLK